jgi:hypothetical protein
MRVEVFPSQELVRRGHLFQALRDLFSIDFVGCDDLGAETSCSATLLFGVTSQQAAQLAPKGLPCLAFLDDASILPLRAEDDVSLSPTVALVPSFRGRVLPDKSLVSACRLRPQVGDVILAMKSDEVLWLRRRQGTSSIDLVATQAPNLAEDGHLFEFFQKDNWARLLPLLHFLREVTDWKLPPLRACFMFDDPNLHWKSYGYVNYAKLAKHAEAHNYHVSFATVPLDGWRAHSGAVSLFREHKRWLSLLVHGNNHTFRELGQVYTDLNRRGLAAQALSRIKHLERISGLDVPRVMAPPHGACLHETATALLQTGFEAACISRGSIMAFNPGAIWPATVGLNVAEFLGDGLPVLPRFRMRRDCLRDIMFAAFLGQAIIPVGHHGDISDGLDLLQGLAEIINSLGDVKWIDMKSIARSNFCTRREDRILDVRMHSRHIALKVPTGFDRILVDRPWLGESKRERLGVRNGNSDFTFFESPRDEAIPVQSGAEVEIYSDYPEKIDYNNVVLPRTPLKAIARRQLCEARDRLAPTLDRLSFKPTKK